MANVPKDQIKEKLAKTMKCKEEAITIFGLKNKYGGGRSTGFALVYENLDKKKKYDSKTNLKRVSQAIPFGGAPVSTGCSEAEWTE